MSRTTKKDANATQGVVEAPVVELSGILITKEAFASQYKLVSRIGKWKLPVANVSAIMPALYADGTQVFSRQDNSALNKRIVNLKAIPLQYRDKVIEAWKEHATEDGLDLAYLRPYTMSVNAFVPTDADDIVDVPMNGEQIHVSVIEVENRQGEMIFAGQQFTVPGAIAGANFSFEDNFITLEQGQEKPE